MPEYLVVRISARVTPRVQLESDETYESDATIKRTIRYEVLFPARYVEEVERRLRLVVKRTKDKVRRLAPLRIANLDLYPVDKRDEIIRILEEGREQYWNTLKELAEEFQGDWERLQDAMYFKYSLFKVWLPEKLVQSQALDTVISEIKGLREFLEKYAIPQEHKSLIEKVEELDPPEDTKETIVKVLSLALSDNGKVRQRAKTVLRHLKERLGDSPVVRLLERILECSDINEAVQKVAEVIAEEKYIRKIEELEDRIAALSEELRKVQEEKRKVEEEAKRRLEELKRKLEELEKQKQQSKQLQLELEEIEINVNALRKFGTATRNLEILRELDDIEIKLTDLKRKRPQPKLNIDL